MNGIGKRSLATTVAFAALVVCSQAQSFPHRDRYDSNWAPMHVTGMQNMVAFSGPGLFGSIFGDGHYAKHRDSIRR